MEKSVRLIFIFCAAAIFGPGFRLLAHKLLDANNQPARIAGVNWHGFEGTPERPHGL